MSQCLPSASRQTVSGQTSHMMIMLLVLVCTLLTTTTPTPVASQAVDWSHLTDVTLGALTADQFMGATAADLNSIPYTACVGFTAMQFGALGLGAYPTNISCSGFTGACVANIAPSVFVNMTAPCMTSFSADGLGQPSAANPQSAAQIAQIPPTIISYLTSTGISEVTTGCGGFTTTQIPYLGSTNTACTSLSAACLQSATAWIYPYFSQACIQSTPPTAFSLLTAPQVSNFTNAIVARLTAAQLQAFSSSGCAGFSTAQIEGFGSYSPYNTCTGFTSGCLGQILPNQLINAQGLGLTELCLESIQPTAFTGFTSAQIAVLPWQLVRDINATQFAQLQSSACSTFTAAQVQVFGQTFPDACSGIQPACWATMPSAVFGDITAACILKARDDAFSQTSSTSLSQLTTSAMGALSENQLGNINLECSGFTSAQISAITGATCQGFTATCINSLLTTSVGGFLPDCMANMAHAAFGGWTVDQIPQIPVNVIGSINQNQIALINPASCAGFQTTQIPQFGNGTSTSGMCFGISSQCWGNFSSSVFGEFTANCVANAANNGFQTLSAAQVGAFTPTAAAAMSSFQLSNLDSPACSGLTINQTSLFGANCAGITNGCLQDMTTSAVHGFTDTCTDSLQPVLFSTITAEQVAALTTAAVGSISGAQMASITNTSCAGFSSIQLPYLQATACEQTSNGCFFYIPDTSYNGILSSCIDASPPNSFSLIGPNQFGAFLPNSIGALSPAQVAAIPTASFSGLTLAQIPSLTTGCAGVNAAAFSSIQQSVFAGLSSGCILSLPAAAFTDLTSTLLGAIPTTVIGYVSASQISKINPSMCMGFTQPQIAQFGTATADMCSGLSSVCFQSIEVAAYTGFTASCVSTAMNTSFSLITTAQLNQLTPAAVGAITPQQFTLLADVCDGFNSTQTAAFNAHCSGILPNCISKLTDDATSGIPPACMAAFNPNIFPQWRVSQVRVLAPDTVAQIQADQIQQIRNDSCRGFNATQLAAFGSVVNTCSGVDSGCFHFMNATTFAGITAGCVSQAKALAFSKLDQPDQLGYFPATAVAALSSPQLSNLIPSTCSGFNKTQIGSLYGGSCVGIQHDCLSNIDVDAISGITNGCMATLLDNTFAAFTSAQIAVITPEVMGYVNETQIHAMLSDACTGFTAAQVSNFGLHRDHCCHGIGALCYSKMSDATFTGFTAACVVDSTVDAFSLISANQATQLPLAAVGGLNSDQLNNFADLGCSGLTANQTSVFGTVSSTACEGIKSSCLKQITVDAMGGIQGSCVDWLNPAIFTDFSSQQIGALIPSAVEHITTGQARYLASTNCGGFNAQQALVFPATTMCYGLVGQCMGSFSLDVLGNIQGACFSQIQPPALTTLSSAQFGAITGATFKSLNALQLAGLQAQQCQGFTVADIQSLEVGVDSICNAFTTACLTALPLPTLNSLGVTCLTVISPTVLVSLNLTQLAQLAPTTMPGITTPQLNQLFTAYGKDVLDNFNVAQGNAIDSTVLLTFKAGVENGSIAIKEQWTAQTNLTLMNALQLADCGTDCLNFLFVSSSAVRTFNLGSWAGLRASQMKLIGAGTTKTKISQLAHASNSVGNVSWIPDAAWGSFQSDAISAISAPQLVTISPAAFATLPIGELSTFTIPALTPDQMQSVPLATYAALDCPSFLSLTTSQRNTLSAMSFQTEQGLQAKCGLPTSSSSSSGGVVSSSSSSSSGPGGDSSSTGGSPDSPSSGLSKAELGGIIGGSVGFVLLVVGLIFFCRKRRASPEEEPFVPNENSQPRYD